MLIAAIDPKFQWMRDAQLPNFPSGGSLARFGDGELKLLRGKKGGWEDPRSDGGAMARAGLAFAASLGGRPDALRVCVGTVPLLDGSFARFRPGSRRDFWRNFYPPVASGEERVSFAESWKPTARAHRTRSFVLVSCRYFVF